MSKFLLAALFVGSVIPGYSQLLSFGVKGGVPLTDPLESRPGRGFTEHGRHPYVFGATGELHLPFGFSVEVDALYRRLSYDSFTEGSLISPAAQFATTGSDWQFPILAKYRFKQRPFLRPFVDGGVTYRHVSFSRLSIGNPNTAGVSVGGGIEFKFLFLRLSPEIRYTYFPTEAFGTAIFYNIGTTSNQADFLVGLTF